jgi:putative spermidine/putrescine transport system substrate-binding protein
MIMTKDPTHHATGDMAPGRRQFLAGAALTATIALARPAILRAAPATLTVPNSGGALEEAYKAAYFDTFEKKTGIRIIGAPYMDAARVKAMVDNNAVDADVLNIDATEAATLAQQGLLEPIDYGIVDKSSLIPAAAKKDYLLVDVAALVMAWNTHSVTDAKRPTTWKEYFDPSVPGQRSLWKLASQTVDVAAMGAGQPPDKLYPLDLDKAFAALTAIKPKLSWWTSGAQSAQLLIGGEVDLGTSWNGRLYKPKNEGAPVNYTYDQALYTCDAMIVPKGAKNKKVAMDFLANMVDPQNQATFAQHIPYGPVNTKAFALLDDKTKALLPNSPENSKTAVFQDFDYWAQNGEAIFDRFNKWLISG